MAKTGLPRISSNFDSLEKARTKLHPLVLEAEIRGAETLSFVPLGAREAIGSPSPKGDYPLEQGKEKLMEASFRGFKGQVFTSHASEGSLSVDTIFSLSLESQKNRALCIAGMNALGAAIGITENTIHCRDESPNLCGKCMSHSFIDNYGLKAYIGIVGYNPGIISNIIYDYGSDHVFITDLNPDNIGTNTYGVEVWNGFTELKRLCKMASVLLVTGSALANNTLDMVRNAAELEGKDIIYYGTSIAVTASVLGYKRWCFEAN